MERELKFINAGTKRFQYVSPIPTIRPIREIGLYASDTNWKKYYNTFSSTLDSNVIKEFQRGVIGIDVINTKIYMSLVGDNDFCDSNVLKYLENHRILYYNCTVFEEPVSVPILLINPIRIKGYEAVRKQHSLKPYTFMKWVDDWCKVQTIGSRVLLDESPYYSKVKGYLIGNGYEEGIPNLFNKVENPPLAEFNLL